MYQSISSPGTGTEIPSIPEAGTQIFPSVPEMGTQDLSISP